MTTQGAPLSVSMTPVANGKNVLTGGSLVETRDKELTLTDLLFNSAVIDLFCALVANIFSIFDSFEMGLRDYQGPKER